jgi:hypothetical protein
MNSASVVAVRFLATARQESTFLDKSWKLPDMEEMK